MPTPEGFWETEGLKIFREARPMRTVKLIKCVKNIIYVTARPIEAEAVTRDWLKKHSLPNAKIIFTNRTEKPAIFAALNPFLIIEDEPQIISKIKLPTLVPQWPYNSHLRGPYIYPF